MKSLQVIVLTTIIVFLVSCGGSGDGGLDIQAEDFQRLNGGGFDTINLGKTRQSVLLFHVIS